ncbi:dTDP-4-amino-4,6-dideoxygalactose transaminase [Kaistia dalseonensis]|uniref:dTDP-4-amino-4,6-dideoxygalactose transaminase n=1 Tax=Kaistia dalseonensis TaxID=410840 RepID=A0ABU0H7I8_9HYPH|nr:dTDP-4-amino-4,6-dideoxygalactose transaminase [Kaistia dalseonensis]MDQ0438277.1 dTDP-4-amino-4,6-dideoxygalactose transaminase [Kaistia dalseonensis]
MSISLNEPFILGSERDLIAEALAGGTSGNGVFTNRCQDHLQKSLGVPRVLLTTSCTSALEMATILTGVGPGDEVILPSFTFSSTANAVVLRNAVPVFVDIRPDTLNIDERLIEAAITPKTKAIIVVHYAGVACNMDSILSLADRYSLPVIEDAAQAFGSSYKGRPLGTFGTLGCLSFHETKNVISGEGGALIVNDESLIDRAEIIWEKGTDRLKFKRGVVSKYEWVDVGSSFLPNEITAAFLYAQLEGAPAITSRRRAIWDRYHAGLAALERQGLLMRPSVPIDCEGNGHIYFILAPDRQTKERWLKVFSVADVGAVSHYVPLHSAPAGRRFGITRGSMSITDDTFDRLIRLPMHARLSDEEVDIVLRMIEELVGQSAIALP